MDKPVFCYACGTGLQKRKGDRRLLSSGCNQHVMPILRKAAECAVAKLAVNLQLDQENLSHGCICRPCFRALEKVQKLQEQLNTLQEKIITNAANAVQYLPTKPAALSPEGSVGDSNISLPSDSLCGLKHSLPPSLLSLKRRRLQLEFQAVSSNATSSPPVSVSFNCFVCDIVYRNKMNCLYLIFRSQCSITNDHAHSI